MKRKESQAMADCLERLGTVETKILSLKGELNRAEAKKLAAELDLIRQASIWARLPRVRIITDLAQDLLETARPNHMTTDLVNTLLSAVDALRTLILNLDGKHEGSIDEHLALLTELSGKEEKGRNKGSKGTIGEGIEESLWQLIYVSVTPQGRMDASELLSILEGSRERNEGNGITGMLTYRDTYFMQVLEGPKDAVEETFERIEKDKRHDYAIVLSRQWVEQRSFPDWSMGFHMMRCMQNADIEGLSKRFSEVLWDSEHGDFAHQLLGSFKENLELL